MTDEQKDQVARLQAEYNTIIDRFRDLDDRDGPLAQNIAIISQMVSDNEYDIAGMQKQLKLYDEHHEDAPAGAGILTTLHIVSGVESGTSSNRQMITDMLQELEDKRKSLAWQAQDLSDQLYDSNRERECLRISRGQVAGEILARGGVVVVPTDAPTDM